MKGKLEVIGKENKKIRIGLGVTRVVDAHVMCHTKIFIDSTLQ